MIFLIWIAGLSGLAISVMVGARLAAIRVGRVTVFEQPPLLSMLEQKIDWLAVFLVLLCREGARYVSLHILLGIRKLGSYLKVAGFKIEKRFSHVIDMVHGKGAVSKKGAVSFFLREMSEHKTSRKSKVIK